MSGETGNGAVEYRPDLLTGLAGRERVAVCQAAAEATWPTRSDGGHAGTD